MAPAEYDYTKYLAELRGVLDSLPLSELKQAADIIFHAYQNDRTVFLFGNGGSAALASHLATDLAKGTHFPGPSFMKNVRRLKAVSLTDNVPLMTAWSNDLDYENVFTGQMENFIRARDVAFAISGSGNSPNVLRAVELAKQVGATTIGLTGYDGGQLRRIADRCIVVPCDNMQQIEDIHLIICHLIFVCLRDTEAAARL